jgi:hypothetical protein
MRFLLCCLLLFVFTSAFSQIEKGRLSIGGSILSGGRSRTTVKTVNNFGTTVWEIQNTNVTFTPAAGKFLTDNFLLGVSMNASLVNTKYKSVNLFGSSAKSNSLTLSIGPYAQYFFGGNESGRPYVQLSPQIGTTSFDGENYNPQNTFSLAYGGSLTAGYALFLNDSFFFTFFIAYRYTHSETDYENNPFLLNPTESTENTDQGWSFGVSINNTFLRKK